MRTFIREIGNKKVIMTSTSEGYTRVHKAIDSDEELDAGGGPLIHTDSVSTEEGDAYIELILSNGYTEQL